MYLAITSRSLLASIILAVVGTQAIGAPVSLRAAAPASSAATVGGSTSSGAALVNLGSIDLGDGSGGGAFINFMKTFVPTALDPNQLDEDGYPIGNGANGPGSLSSNYGTGWKIPAILQKSNVAWIIRWPASRTFSLVVNVPVNVSASTNCSSCRVGSSTTLTIRSQGTSGSVKFNFTAQLPTNSVSGYFESGSRYNSNGQSGEIAFLRATDETAYDAGAIYTPEFISTLKGLNPKTIRPMGWTFTGSANYTNEVRWRYRTQPTQLSYVGYRFKKGAWGGSVTGKAALTIAAAPDTNLNGWVDGEVIQGNITTIPSKISVLSASDNGLGYVRLTVSSASSLSSGQSVWITNVGGLVGANGIHSISLPGPYTCTNCVDLLDTKFSGKYTGGGILGAQTLTIKGKSGGPKFLADQAGWTLFTQGSSDGPTTANQFVTFIYDAILDRVICNPFGLNNTVPIELQVSLANTLGSNLWINYPTMADDDYVASMTAVPLKSLNAQLDLYVEYGNEIWNNGFPLTSWSYNRGLSIGWPDSGNAPLHGWYGLRYRQLMGNVTAQWGTRSGLKRVIGSKAFDTPTQVGPQRLGGTYLHKVDVSHPANLFPTKYAALGFSDSYSAAPNRPVDYADVFSYATYYEGSNLTNGGFYSATYPSVVAFLRAVANNSATLDGTAATLSAIDSDFRCASGACSGPNKAQTLYGLTQVYPIWTSLLTSYSGSLKIESYEGGLEALAPTAAQCSAMGIVAPPLTGGIATAQGCSDQISSALAAYKNSTFGYNIVIDQMVQAKAAGVATPAWLSLSGPSQWSLFPGDIYSSAPFQTYRGLAAFR